MRKTLSDKGIKAFRPKAKPYVVPDPETKQLYVRVLPSGTKSYTCITYSHGKQKWIALGDASILSIEQAREKARTVIGRVHDGLPAFEAPPESFEKVAMDWHTRHVLKNNHRRGKANLQILQRLVFPSWKDRPFDSIRRRDVAALLDHAEDKVGPSTANAVLIAVSSIMSWYATRNEDFRSPLIKGMARYNVRESARTRILNDDEIRLLWAATETSGPFDGLIRIALLTAQRLAKVRTMQWEDIEDGVWTIATEKREKNNAGTLALPKLALDVLNAQVRMIDSPYVFVGRRRYDKPVRGAVFGLAKRKTELDAKLPKDFPHWTIHDLRRTARSLMSRAGVPSEHAERVLGHAIRGVEATYDRHDYDAEKAEALRKLAGLVETIISPTPNVVPIRGAKRK